jgi:hypothetical protein
MNRIQLRDEVGRWAQKAETEKAYERPSAADVEALKRLWDFRKAPSILSASVSSSIGVIYGDDPDWNSWPSIAARFKMYHAALVEIDNKSSAPMAGIRLRGA